MITTSSNRQHHIDEKFESNVSDIDFSNKLLLRLVAKGIRFDKVTFKYSIFDTCYLRDCVFDSCDFTGCRFIGVNFYGASFSGCKFDYATFERTIIDSDILDVGCPGLDNIKLKFARTLRMNFQQLGDSTSANKAIRVELDATGAYLYKACWSNESYYRKKYVGIKRFRKIIEWITFKALDFIWGNGERTIRLFRFVGLTFLVMSVIHVIGYEDVTKVSSYWNSLLLMPSIFLGVSSYSGYPDLYLAIITFTRLVIMGFFLSIILKRFNRR